MNDRDQLLEKCLTALSEDIQPPEISQSVVLEWFNFNDIEDLGAVYALITDKRFLPSVSPMLTSLQVFGFVFNYLLRCIKESPDGEWSDSRYTAGWDLANWIKHWAELLPSQLPIVSSKIADLYSVSDEKVRRCIIDATLEHVLSNNDVKMYFENWKDDACLYSAYNEAAEFSGKV